MNPSFIHRVPGSGGVKVDSSYIYWSGINTIVRASLDGRAINPAFISGATIPLGIALQEP